MQQIVEVTEENWLYSCPGTMQVEVEDKMDTVEACEMMNGMCADKRMKDLNL